MGLNDDEFELAVSLKNIFDYNSIGYVTLPSILYDDNWRSNSNTSQLLTVLLLNSVSGINVGYHQ